MPFLSPEQLSKKKQAKNLRTLSSLYHDNASMQY